ncbi:ileal sodium/bile acid cotransporter-like [Diadema setosum]|uniref:ileal sodium/bile acid cotransporter-like n=1 Tax=Diadema setosum TaxID=31175 RepID=UPI003B3A7498
MSTASSASSTMIHISRIPVLVGVFLSLLVILIPVKVSAVDATEASEQQIALINVTFDTEVLYLTEGREETFNFTILHYLDTENATIAFQSASDFAFKVVNASDATIAISPADDYPKTMRVTLRGNHISISELSVLMSVGESVFEISTTTVKTNLVPNPVYVIVNYVTLGIIILSFVTMGMTIDLKLIWERLRRPWAVLIGMLCQFFIMPALAFGLAKAFSLDSASAIGLVLDGSCPGGYLSNTLSVILDADYVLSLTMTFCSNVLAMGMMPLNLFIYTTRLTDDNESLDTPFIEIAIQLIILIIPIGLGMIIRYKWPSIKDKAMKLLKPVSTIVLAITLATSLPFQLYIFAAPWNVYVAAFLLPLCGAFCGSVISKITCIKPNAAIVTISLETGVQNALMATSIISLFYPHPEAELAARVPFLIFLMTLFEGIAIAAIYLPYKKFFKKDDGEEGDDKKKTIKDEKMKEVYAPEEMKEKRKEKSEEETEQYTNPAFENN